MTNYSFFRGRSLVPASREKFPPELQYTDYTSETSKKMGEIIKQPPAKIDNLIQGWTGGLGRYATNILDTILRKTGVSPDIARPSPTLADRPVIKAFVVRNPYGSSSESMDSFYNKVKEYEQGEKYLQEMLNTNEQVKFDTFKAKHPELLFAQDFAKKTSYSASARFLRKVAGQLSDIGKKQDEIYKSTTLTSQEKREAINEMDKLKTDIARQALENLGEVDKPFTAQLEDIWDKMGTVIEDAPELSTGKPKVSGFKEVWQDTVPLLKDFDPKTLTEAKGYKKWTKVVMEGYAASEEVGILPGVRIRDINTDPQKGLTLQQLYSRWQERMALTDPADIDEFDRKHPQAYLGNISWEELTQATEYSKLSAKDKAAYLKGHPELDKNPQDDWFKKHPYENSIMALAGKATILTQKAYDEAQRLIKELDIPDSAVKDYLPPREHAKAYFDLQDLSEKFGTQSWEVKLELLKNDKLREYMKREKPDDLQEVLEIKVKSADKFRKYDGYSDKDSEFYIENDDLRKQALENMRNDDIDFRKDLRRIEALNNGAQSTQDIISRSKQAHIDLLEPENQPVPLSEEGIRQQKEQIERYDFVSKVIRDINKGTRNQADIDKAVGYIQENITSDEGVLRSIEASGQRPSDFPTYNYVKPHVEELKYVLGVLQGKADMVEKWVEVGEKIKETSANSAEVKLWFIDNPDVWQWAQRTGLREDAGEKWNVPALRIDVKYRKEDAEYQAILDKNEGREESKASKEYLQSHEEYRKDRRRREAYSLSNAKTGEKFPDTEIENYVAYNEISAKGKRRDRFLIENPDFAKAMHAVNGMDLPDPAKVPDVAYDDIYDQYQKQFDELEGLSDAESDFYIENEQDREFRRKQLRFDREGKYTEFGMAGLRRDAYAKFVSEKDVETYAGYYKIIGEGKGKDYELKNETDLWYEDDWFLMENIDWYKEVYVKHLGNQRKDFRKVPTRAVFKKYLTFLVTPEGKARDDFRWNNLDLDEWLVRKFEYKSITEKKRRAGLSAQDRLNEEVQERLNRLRSLVTR